MTYEQTEADFNEIHRSWELPPDELYDHGDDEPYDHDEEDGDGVE